MTRPIPASCFFHRIFGLFTLACLLFLVFSTIRPCQGQNLLPNPSFEVGTNQPNQWRLTEGAGSWNTNAFEGSHAISVTGKGEDQSTWYAPVAPLQPRGLYRLRFQGRRSENASGGTAVSGPSPVNRDFPMDSTWRSYGYIFRIPDGAEASTVRLGQWHVNGTMLFDQTELFPVMPAHLTTPEGVELGEGESIEKGVYSFKADFGWAGANYHRTLLSSSAGFNSDRCLFSSGSEMVYQFQVAGAPQKSAQIGVSIGYYIGGSLRVEASRDAKSWVEVAKYDGKQRGGKSELPASLFPAETIYVRLSHQNPGAGFQVNSLAYEAPLAKPLADAHGATWFMDIQQSSPKLEVKLQQLRLERNINEWRCDFALTATNALTQRILGQLWLDATGTNQPSGKPVVIRLAGSGKTQLTCPVGLPGLQTLKARFTDERGNLLFAGQTEVKLGFLDDSRPGYWLSHSDNLGVWWCESGWKIGLERGMPAKTARNKVTPVKASLARGEYEAVQVILRPDRDAQLLSATCAGFSGPTSDKNSISVSIDEVAYVNTSQPTDETCVRGLYPDPLPPLQSPLALKAGLNQPLWITFYVPPKTKTGDYRAELELKTTLATSRVPVLIHVYDFELPAETHLRSALGMGAHSINQYHRLTRPEDKQAVYEKYLRNFADHRISPYSFFEYSPMDIRFEGEGAAKKARIDFTRFDKAAARWLDEFHFNSFLLPLKGMGGGTYQSRSLGKLEGFQEGTPEHAQLFHDYLSQVEEHLRGRGWLDKAYTYWFDEPDPKDYEFVAAGMNRIKQAAPGVKRMLTEQPEPGLIGNVDIWCGLTPEWTHERVRGRQKAGEQVWWYICCAPRAPYVTEFIDHPGTELRLWPWQSWQYGVSGILIWETVYWNSPTAFRSPALQNPWADPMSYVSDSTFQPGQIGYWGNGDGRFLYPPRREPSTSAVACTDAPINSMRWESLRDGMEDYEYLWLLQKELDRAKAKSSNLPIIQEAERLLTVPPSVSQDLTHFTQDPRTILNQRDQIARMIERLRNTQGNPR